MRIPFQTLKMLFMKLKFIIFCVLTAVLVSSFYLLPKKSEKKWCSCSNVSNIHKTARNDNFVTISWNAPSGGDPVQYYSYGGVSGGAAHHLMEVHHQRKLPYKITIQEGLFKFEHIVNLGMLPVKVLE